jgi:hypothetical protein
LLHGDYVHDLPFTIPAPFEKFMEIGFADADGCSQAQDRQFATGNQTSDLSIGEAEVPRHFVDRHQTRWEVGGWKIVHRVTPSVSR